jgi:transcriptional regulator with XRE-family HTH domain
MARRRRELTDSLVARRISLGLSQTQVAARMGTSQSAVARIEAARSDVRLSTLERYAAALDRVIDWRLDEERP